MELPPAIFGTLIRRYKRFLADVKLEDGSVITAHCPNTGRMTTCAEPGWRVALSDSKNPKRKYRFTWELVHNGQCWICMNTGRANEVAAEALKNGVVPELAGYSEVLREQTFGNSRFDLLLKGNAARAPVKGRAPLQESPYCTDEPEVQGVVRASPQRGERAANAPSDPLCYVEVKNVTLLAQDGCYAFPDAVTERGRKHLNELVEVVKAGHRAAMLYVIPRSDGTGFRAAHEIDPAYAEALSTAVSAGVELYAWRADVSPEEIRLVEPVDYRNR